MKNKKGFVYYCSWVLGIIGGISFWVAIISWLISTFTATTASTDMTNRLLYICGDGLGIAITAALLIVTINVKGFVDSMRD